MNTTKQENTELKRTFGGALKGLFLLDLDIYVEYLETLIRLYEEKKEEELHIIECLTSFDMFDEYIAELPEEYEGTAFWSKNTVLCLVSHVMDNSLQRKLIKRYLERLSIKQLNN